MRVAHFGIFAPHASGQYETIKDLILAERSVGIDAQFIDCGSDDKLTVREGLEDRGIKTMPLKWAMENADIAVRHSVVPDDVFKKIPVVLALHGRPESSFRLEYNDKMPVISSVMRAAKSDIYRNIFTFWPEHVYLWERIIGNGNKIGCVPAPVDLEEYTPHGEKYNFGNFKAKINLMIADIWREDTIPFNLIFAAQFFKEKYYDNTKLHIYGISSVKKKCFSFLSHLQKTGVIGEVSGVIGFLPKIYRSANVLLTPNTIATRVVREAMASGLPIVSPQGCSYATQMADPRDYRAFADAIAKCYTKTSSPQKRLAIRKRAEKEFSFKAVGSAMKDLLEKAIKKTPINVNSKSITNKQLVEYGKAYCKTITDLEHSVQRTMRRNERAIEIAYVFKNLTKYYPSTVLDVGTGQSSLPHLMSSVRFEVDAIDSQGNFWANGMFNRHFKVDKQDIVNHTIKRHYDFITCVSTLEHVFHHQIAVKNMLDLLNPEGILLITVPYNENEYVDNVYRRPEAGYGHNFNYICQVFSRKEVESWGGTVLDQEYWKVFHGKFWTFGRQHYPPIKTSKEDPHHLTCLLLGK